MGYVFISYSSQNKKQADAVRGLLLAKGLDCWMAPYSIPPGEKYAGAITRGIRDCSCLLLLLTDAAQQSEAVDKEVERAIHYRKPLLALQLEQLQLTDSFEYYLSNSQIVFPSVLDESDSEFGEVLRVMGGHCGTTLTPSAPQATAPTPAAPADEKPAAPADEEALPEDGEECYRLGAAYHFGTSRKEDPARALLCYRRAAELSCPLAYRRLGMVYAYGWLDVEKDAARSLEYYRQGAALGDADCMKELGQGYLYGTGKMEVCEPLGMMYCLMAEERGCEAAVLDIAGCYEDGTGVPCAVPERALYWYKRAEEKEYDVKEELAGLREELAPLEKNKAQIERSLEPARKLLEAEEATPELLAKVEGYLQEAVKLGSGEACRLMAVLRGVRYDENGEAVAENMEEAMQWFARGAEAGDAEAASYLGRGFLYGTGLEEDAEAAVSCLLMAAEMGDAEAQYELGRCCDEGTGLPAPERELATYWYKKAAAQGNKDARLALTGRD